MIQSFSKVFTTASTLVLLGSSLLTTLAPVFSLPVSALESEASSTSSESSISTQSSSSASTEASSSSIASSTETESSPQATSSSTNQYTFSKTQTNSEIQEVLDENGNCKNGGYKVEYFSARAKNIIKTDYTNEIPQYLECAPKVDFDWQDKGPEKLFQENKDRKPGTKPETDYFSVRFSKPFTPASSKYNFSVKADNIFRLGLADKNSNKINTTISEKTYGGEIKEVNLDYEISSDMQNKELQLVLEYHETKGNASVKFDYQGKEENDETPELKIPAKYKDLYEKVKKEGTVRVIATLKDVEFGDTETIRQKTEQVKEELELPEALEFKFAPAFTLALTNDNFAEIFNHKDISFVEEDGISKPALVSSNNVIRNNLIYNNTPTNYRGRNTYVAVLDTGASASNPFLANSETSVDACFSLNIPSFSNSICPNGANIQVGPGSSQDCVVGISGCDHGSHVAGIAAGVNNGSFYGVASEAGLINVNVFHNNLSTNDIRAWNSDQLRGLEHVWDLKVNQNFNVVAVNLSLGGGGPFNTSCSSQSAYNSTMNRLKNAGVAVVIAAGNESFTNGVSSPACIAEMIAVGASRDNDTRAPFSNSGQLLDLYAPGVNIQSATNNTGYATYSGTSMAAPHVAGAIAVLQEVHFSLYGQYASVSRIENVLKSTGVPITAAGITRPRIDVCAAATALGATTPCGAPGVLSSRIEGLVFNDANSNGLFENNETIKPNVPVQIYSRDSVAGTTTLVASSTTDNTGAYRFENLSAGDYRLVFENSETSTQLNLITNYTSTNLQDSNNNDVDPNLGYVDFSLTNGQEITYIYAGYLEAWEIGGYTFEDTNLNGASLGGGTVWTNDIELKLYEHSGGVDTFTGRTSISANPVPGFAFLDGFYSFENLNPNKSYVVEVVLANSNDVVTLKNAIVNTFWDSDFNRDTNKTDPITVDTINSLGGAFAIDAGFYRTSQISSTVFNDTNGNGLRNAGEPGVNGVTVQLLNANGTGATDALGNPVPASTTANVNGTDGVYSFTKINPLASYRIRVTLPTGATFTQNIGPITDTNNSDINPATSESANFNVTYASNVNYVGIGLVTATIADLVITGFAADATLVGANYQVTPGQVLTFTGTVTNAGSTPALGVTADILVGAALPQDQLFNVGSEVIIQNLPATINPGDTHNYVMQITILNGSTYPYNHTVEFQASASNDATPNISPVISVVVNAPILTNNLITTNLTPNYNTNSWITCSPDTINPAQTTTCSGTIPNNYQAPATLEISIDGQTTTCTITGLNFTCNPITLNNPGTFEVQIDADNGTNFVTTGETVTVNTPACPAGTVLGSTIDASFGNSCVAQKECPTGGTLQNNGTCLTGTGPACPFGGTLTTVNNGSQRCVVQENGTGSINNIRTNPAVCAAMGGRMGLIGCQFDSFLGYALHPWCNINPSDNYTPNFPYATGTYRGVRYAGYLVCQTSVSPKQFAFAPFKVLGGSYAPKNTTSSYPATCPAGNPATDPFNARYCRIPVIGI